MNVKKSNDEVLVANDRIIKLQCTFIESLKKKAANNTRKRIRLCAHKNVNDTLHEMFIVHMRGNYIRPHKHHNKIESLYVIEGRADIVLFDSSGGITDVINAGNYASGYKFYYRIEEPSYHTMLIKSEYFVFHEITNGPFRASDTVFAPWSPVENDLLTVKKFLSTLAREAKKGKVS
jgi:cupin fold WbuC family metalloprotein